jgi:hypothetical protein
MRITIKRYDMVVWQLDLKRFIKLYPLVQLKPIFEDLKYTNLSKYYAIYNRNKSKDEIVGKLDRLFAIEFSNYIFNELGIILSKLGKLCCYISLDDLIQLSDTFNISEICRQNGLDEKPYLNKISTYRFLTFEESEAITKAILRSVAPLIVREFDLNILD